MNHIQDYGQNNFNLPHDVVPLPSQGFLYKNKKKTIKVGYLTAQDENLLMSNNMDNNNIITQLLRSKIFEPDMKIDDMLSGDVEAVLLFLRNTAFGPKYEVSTFDPKTGERFTANIDLSELNIKKIDVYPNEQGLYTTELPATGDEVTLRLMTYGEELNFDKEMSLYPKGITAPIITNKLDKHIVAISGDEDRLKISEYINRMIISDSKYIRKFLKDVEPRLDLMKKVQTPSGEMIDINVNFGVEFFRPFFSL